MENKKIQLTQEGYDEIQKRYRELVDVIEKKNREDLAHARSMGDLSENEDYKQAKNQQAIIQQEIDELTNILENCEIIKNTSNVNVVSIGKIVEFVNLDKNITFKVKIVSSVEVNAEGDVMKFSNVSPIGKGLIGHKVDDVVTIDAPKPYKAKILSIKDKE